jgi:PAS domain S-box-containing protein
MCPFRDLDNANLHKDGRRVHLSTNGIPIIDADGRLAGYRGLDRDVTASKLAEISLRESEARYRDMFEASPHPMWMLDAQSLAFLTVNDAALRTYGYDRKELLARTFSEIAPPDREAKVLAMQAAALEGRPYIDVYRHERTAGPSIVADRTAQLEQASRAKSDFLARSRRTEARPRMDGTRRRRSLTCSRPCVQRQRGRNW